MEHTELTVRRWDQSVEFLQIHPTVDILRILRYCKHPIIPVQYLLYCTSIPVQYSLTVLYPPWSLCKAHTRGQVVHIPHARFHLYTPLSTNQTTIYPQNNPKKGIFWHYITYFLVLRAIRVQRRTTGFAAFEQRANRIAAFYM